MDKRKTLVLGAGGMLGSAVFRALYDSKYEVVGTVRSASSLRYFSADQQLKIRTDVNVLDDSTLVDLLLRERPDVVINCVGVIKQLAASADPLVAVPLNTLLPHTLARLTALSGARLVHISTDCVFSGATGQYTEDSVPDAADLYGLSKRLGEVADYRNAITLRTSMIGHELATAASLVDWFLAQTGTVRGYAKAIFSGLPTCELAAVIKDHIIPNESLWGLYHVSAGPISKLDLLQLIAAEYRKDITIVAVDDVVIDRSLRSDRFSAATGYVAPAWPELVKRMHHNDLRRDR